MAGVKARNLDVKMDVSAGGEKRDSRRAYGEMARV
jgi:hypothetical protein